MSRLHPNSEIERIAETAVLKRLGIVADDVFDAARETELDDAVAVDVHASGVPATSTSDGERFHYRDVKARVFPYETEADVPATRSRAYALRSGEVCVVSARFRRDELDALRRLAERDESAGEE